MTASPFAAPEPVAAEQKVKRDQWNRPVIMQPDGSEKAYTRMTTLAKTIEDTHNLEAWKIRNAMLGLVERPDLLLSVRAHRDDKSELNRLAEEAQQAAKSKAKATIGTALHKLTESIDRGEDVFEGVPLDWVPDLAAYQRETARLEMLAMEQFRVVDELEVAGTADRVCRFRDKDTGRAFIADTKSGSIDYPLSIAMQLAGYAHGKPYDVATGQRLDDPVPVDLSWGVVIHLPQGTGTCQLHWINLQVGWAGLQLAKAVHTFRKTKDVTVPIPQIGVTS